MFAGAGAIFQAQRILSKPVEPRLSFLPAEGWLHEAGARMRTRWLVKMTGTACIMTAFFIVYFWLLNHSRLPVTTVPRIFVDRMIAFRPAALPLYVSLWLYVPLAPALLVQGRDMKVYVAAVLVLSLIGFGIFILWPTTIPKPEAEPSQMQSMIYLKAIDASGNAFPSLHVAFAVFSAMLFELLLREMRSGRLMLLANWLWCLGIIYSTIAIRQHVALDALAGIVLGAILGFVLLWGMRRAVPQ
jgi:membrane-associated phospholipid phosphatase